MVVGSLFLSSKDHSLLLARLHVHPTLLSEFPLSDEVTLEELTPTLAHRTCEPQPHTGVKSGEGLS